MMAIRFWEFVYRFVILVNFIIAHFGLYLTWLLSDTNAINGSANLRDTLIAFLAFDAYFVVPNAIFFTWLTFSNLTRKFTATERATGMTLIGQSASLHLNGM
jgi:hypothetical protein